MVYDGKSPEGNPYELSEFDQSLLPRSKRLNIPIGEPLLMRQVADLLRGLAMQLDHNSRLHDLPERSRRFADLHDITSTNNKIKEAAKLFGSEIKEGRPIANAQDEDEPETVRIGLVR